MYQYLSSNLFKTNNNVFQFYQRGLSFLFLADSQNSFQNSMVRHPRFDIKLKNNNKKDLRLIKTVQQSPIVIYKIESFSNFPSNQRFNKKKHSNFKNIQRDSKLILNDEFHFFIAPQYRQKLYNRINLLQEQYIISDLYSKTTHEPQLVEWFLRAEKLPRLLPIKQHAQFIGDQPQFKTWQLTIRHAFIKYVRYMFSKKGHQFTCNQQNLNNVSRSSQNEKIQVIGKKESVQSSEHLETHKKLKLPRCSLCLKKINYSDLFRCQKCQKTYHIICTDPGDVCFRCLDKEKKKEQKKELKIQKKLEKVNSFPMKKNTTNLQIDSDMDENEKKRIMFLKSYPFYIDGDQIQYPVEDSLFDLYKDVLIPQVRCQRPKPIQLKPYFGSLMEIWSIMVTFPHFFEINQNFSIEDLEKNLVCEKITKNMQVSLLKFMHFHLRDSTWENLQQYRENHYFPFLSLLRFCTQSGFLDRIFVYSWPKFLKACFDLQILSDLNKPQYIQMKQKIQQKYRKGEHEIFVKIQQRMVFLTLLCKTIVDTNSFRGFLNEKSDFEKINNKQKNQLIQLKKQQENKLSAIKDKLKSIIKQKRKIAKLMKKKQFEDQENFEELCNKEKKLEQNREDILDNIKEIDIEVQNMNSSFSGFSNIWLIGRDKDKNNYWFTFDQKDKIIVEKGQTDWSYYPIDNINSFMKSLNLKGIRQNQLYHSLKQYQNLLYMNNIQQNPKEEDNKQENKYTQLQENKFVYSELDGINISNIKLMIAEAERKITKYLQERNARWGNQTQRSSFLDKTLNQFTQVHEFLPQLKFFNERICVVQIEYKIILEDSAEQIDSKTRKIQTKIWGINEKYKHSWFDFAKSCENIADLFFLVSVLFLNIEKYVSKNRKLRKQYEEVKGPTKYMKTKTAQILDQKWNEYCQTCGYSGDLLCCDTCPKVFHLECVGLSQVPQGQYKCKVCMKKRHTRNQIRKFVGE